MSTRLLVLTLLSAVILGVTGAAGQGVGGTQPVTVRSAAFVRAGDGTPSAAMPRGPRSDRFTSTSDHVRPPVAASTQTPGPIIGGQFPNGSPVAGNGWGRSDGQGQGQGKGKGQGQGQGNDNGNGLPGQGVPTGDPGQGIPTGGNGQGQGQPTSDNGQGQPTGDNGQGHPTGDSGQGGPTGDNGHGNGNGQGHPTGDPRRHHGRGGDSGQSGNGQGGDSGQNGNSQGGNSGQVTPPVSNPSPGDSSNTPTPTHAPAVTPTTPVATTPAPIPPVPTSSTPTTHPTPTPKSKPGKGFKVSGLAPVKTKRSSAKRGGNPLTSAAGSGLALPINQVAANLARLAGATGLTGGATGGSQSTAAKLAAAQAAAARAAAARAAARRRSASSSSAPLFSSGIKTVTQIVRFIPSSVWLALAASLGLALMGGIAAVINGRRARNAVHRADEVSAVALTDPLTGVLNRRGFTEAAERELDRAARHGRPFVLAYIDVRGLKRINDGEGHLAGDELLKTATAVLTDSVRAHDVVGRLGGDEFGLLLTEQTAADATHVTERIAEQVSTARDELGFSAHWDLTVGTASFPKDGSTIEELIDTADRRLYEQRGIALSAGR